MILTGEISFRGGMRTKGMHNIVKKITSARAVGKCLMLFCMASFTFSSPNHLFFLP
jgi:hypothetical protein